MLTSFSEVSMFSDQKIKIFYAKHMDIPRDIGSSMLISQNRKKSQLFVIHLQHIYAIVDAN